MWTFPIGASMMDALATAFRGAAMIAKCQVAVGLLAKPQDLVPGSIEVTSCDAFSNVYSDCIRGHNLCRTSLSHAGALLVDAFSVHCSITQQGRNNVIRVRLWLFNLVMPNTAKDSRVVEFDAYPGRLSDPQTLPDVCNATNIDCWMGKEFVTQFIGV
jgi:hypothetical protein